MFSSRIPWALAPNALTVAAEARRRAGAELIDLTESNPTRAGFEYPTSEVLGALADPRALVYEPDPRGIARAREAVADYYAVSLGTRVDPAHVVLTASTSEAYALLFKLLADPGDAVLVPRPSYPLFEFLAALESVRIEHYPLGYDGAWFLDVAMIERALTTRTRAIVVVNPNNPTGSFLKQDELDALVELCRARGLALISDEVFADYGFAPDPRRAPTVAGVEGALAFALSGLSKICALPQMKLGWAVVAGPPGLRAEADARLELIADTYLSVGAPVQHAAPALLSLRARMQSQIAARIRANRAFALATLASDPMSACSALHAEGGWYLVLRLPEVEREESWALDFLEHEGVLVHPGYFFDFPSGAYAVLSLLCREQIFREGFLRLLARVRARLHG